MALAKQNKVKLGIPPAFSERCAIRIKDKSFKAENSKGNPMITLELELVGYFDDSGQLQTKMRRGDTEYQIAGLDLPNTFFTLTPKAQGFFIDFYEKATGTEFPYDSFDEKNPDLSFLDNLVMQGLVSGTSEPYRKQLTEEEKEAKRAAGENNPQGAPILDDEGKQIMIPKFKINKWLKPFKGELPPY
jgi:hypothetical protein